MKNLQKGFASVVLALIVAIVVGGGTYFVLQRHKQSSAGLPATTVTPKQAEQSSAFQANSLNIRKEIAVEDLHIGDTINSLVVSKVSNLAPGEFSVMFSGELTLKGTYAYIQMPGLVCFNIASEDIPKVPNIAGVSKSNFCFSNETLSKQQLPGSGTATVVVKNLFLERLPKGITNLAELVKVIKK
ncbi:MAG: hypothetical protein Q7R64_00045 [bacterium]|nr:hypothetical protein [bacterium]